MTDQSYFTEGGRFIRTSQTVTGEVCAASTAIADYEGYLVELREWLLWQYCASPTYTNEIGATRCALLKSMIDYYVSKADVGDADEVTKRKAEKLDWLIKLSALKTTALAATNSAATKVLFDIGFEDVFSAAERGIN